MPSSIRPFRRFRVQYAVTYKEAPPAPPPGPTNEEKLLMEIREALKGRD